MGRGLRGCVTNPKAPSLHLLWILKEKQKRHLQASRAEGGAGREGLGRRAGQEGKRLGGLSCPSRGAGRPPPGHCPPRQEPVGWDSLPCTHLSGPSFILVLTLARGAGLSSPCSRQAGGDGLDLGASAAQLGTGSTVTVKLQNAMGARGDPSSLCVTLRGRLSLVLECSPSPASRHEPYSAVMSTLRGRQPLLTIRQGPSSGSHGPRCVSRGPQAPSGTRTHTCICRANKGMSELRERRLLTTPKSAVMGKEPRWWRRA